MSHTLPKELLQKIQERDALKAHIASLEDYSLDPLIWVSAAFRWGEGELSGIDGPDLWQREALESIGRQLRGSPKECVIQEATASGHGIGKSTLVAWLFLWAMQTETKGVVTANTATQLKTKTWSEVSKWYRLCKFKSDLKLEATSLHSTKEGFDKEWRIDQVPWSKQNTEAFAGLHNKGKRILIIFDEASAIPDEIWDVTEGALTDSDTQIIWCVFGNPTRNTGKFKECFSGKTSKRWNAKQIDARDCAYSKKDQVAKWAEDYGVDSDFFKVRVRGMFPAMSAKQFISVTDVDAAYGRTLVAYQYNFAPKILTVDPAWEGDDEMVIGIRQGLAFRILRVIAKNDNDMQVAAVIGQIEDEEHADAVFIDAGYGTGRVSAGKTLKRNWQRVWVASTDIPDLGCANMRAYMWNEMKKWLKAGGAIPQDTVLYNDLIGPEIIFRADGKTQLESKKDMKTRGLPSPGRADCLAISFAYPVKKKDEYRKVRDGWPQKPYDPLNNW